ncbi:hypothetical protein ACFL2G_00710 [Candidatus Omnitrophota bacterium]
MIRIGKGYNLKITSLAIVMILSFTGIVYPTPNLKQILRLPTGQADDTFVRIKAAYIRDVLQQHPELKAYLLDDKNTEIRLVALGEKPAYWSYGAKAQDELRIIKEISEKLDLRFIQYQYGTKTSCFIYDPKSLAKVFFQYKEELLDENNYLPAQEALPSPVSFFKAINLETIITDGVSVEKETQLMHLDKFLIAICQRGKANRSEGEPFPIGIAMGYNLEWVRVILERRKGKHVIYHSISSRRHSIWFFSADKSSGDALLERWIKMAEAGKDIISMI